MAYNNCYERTWTVCDANFRYILDPDDNEELYDLILDPPEWNNLARDVAYEEVIARMKGELLKLSRGKRPFLRPDLDTVPISK